MKAFRLFSSFAFALTLFIFTSTAHADDWPQRDGMCGFGELRCLDLATGDRKWETFAATEGKKSLFGQVFIVEQAGRHWLWNDQGELILAKLTPSGYEELSRAKLLPTIEHTRGREVLWCHPAFANVHNGQELLCVSLAATNSPGRVVPGVPGA